MILARSIFLRFEIKIMERKKSRDNTCLNDGAGLLALQMNFIEMKLHYLNWGSLLE
jgi:hypothetical protein